MANSFLDKTGLTYLWGKIVSLVNRKQDALTFDSTPTDNSTNPVTSGGVKAYVDANAGGGDSPVESGSGTGSVQTKAYTDSSARTQTASGDGAFAEGGGTTASGLHAHAEGFNTTASGNNSHAEGSTTAASGNNSHAEGFNTTASGNNSHAEGSTTAAYGDYSHAEGAYTVAFGNYSHAEGGFLNTSGYYSGRIKVRLTGSGTTYTTNDYIYDYCFGKMIMASGKRAVITSIDNTNGTITVSSSLGDLSASTCYIYNSSSAHGLYSHAEGLGTLAKNGYDHAEGYITIARGGYSHSEGESTVAAGAASHAEGRGTIAKANYSHVSGQYNVEDINNTYAEIIGIGDADSVRKNGRTLDWSGNEQLAGSLTLGLGTTDEVTITAAQLKQLLAGL